MALMSKMLRESTPPRGIVKAVEPGSPADRSGVSVGWLLISVNGVPIPDILAYRRELETGQANLTLEGESGQVVSFDVQWEDPGLEFEDVIFDGIHLCANQCEFCYVHQMPKGFRKSLYMMDDDFRTSFLYGSFVTLTNLTQQDVRRILDERLSPLYVSVHTTNETLRGDMMKPLRGKVKEPEAVRIQKMIEQLEAIDLYAQIVLVPGRNDGVELEDSLEYLAGRPNVLAVALVPVGLTEHRLNLPELRTHRAGEIQGIVERVEKFQVRMKAERGSRFAFLSDEFYLASGNQVPPASAYEGYPMLENGVGMVREFLDEPLPELPDSYSGPRRVLLATGALFYPVLKEAIAPLKTIDGLDIEVRCLENRTFGAVTTVAGLLTGRDLIKQIKPGEADLLLLSPNIVRYGTEILLDECSLDDLRNSLMMEVALGETSLGKLGKKILYGVSTSNGPSFGFSNHALKEASQQH
jgi:putative radical SAM enzyme (TIGR03279 family)